MRKFITLTSVGLSIGFAVALANADDKSDFSRSEESTISSEQQPGATGTNPTHPTNPSNPTTTTTQKEWTSADTCVDKDGATWHRGDKNFTSCVKWTEKHKKSDQMGGTVDSSGGMYDGAPQSKTTEERSESSSKTSSSD